MLLLPPISWFFPYVMYLFFRSRAYRDSYFSVSRMFFYFR